MQLFYQYLCNRFYKYPFARFVNCTVVLSIFMQQVLHPFTRFVNCAVVLSIFMQQVLWKSICKICKLCNIYATEVLFCLELPLLRGQPYWFVLCLWRTAQGWINVIDICTTCAGFVHYVTNTATGARHKTAAFKAIFSGLLNIKFWQSGP